MTKRTGLDRSDLAIIGWREIVALPQIGIDRVKVKIDTGARSSALHAFDLKQFEADRKQMISFAVHPRQRSSQETVMAEAELLEHRQVRNSGGVAQLRPVIYTKIQLGQLEWMIELTLTNRDVMGFRMLLGRHAVRDRFLIDPGKSYCQSDRLR